jgi:hypothetical protein
MQRGIREGGKQKGETVEEILVEKVDKSQNVNPIICFFIFDEQRKTRENRERKKPLIIK